MKQSTRFKNTWIGPAGLAMLGIILAAGPSHALSIQNYKADSGGDSGPTVTSHAKVQNVVGVATPGSRSKGVGSLKSADARIAAGLNFSEGNGNGKGPEGSQDSHAVPEPASLLLMGAGLTGLGWWKRRKLFQD